MCKLENIISFKIFELNKLKWTILDQVQFKNSSNGQFLCNKRQAVK